LRKEENLLTAIMNWVGSNPHQSQEGSFNILLEDFCPPPVLEDAKIRLIKVVALVEAVVSN
jgi:hypothetical protein